MFIYTQGPAIIEHGETSEVFEIEEDELDWEPIGGSDRSMGPETIYQALIDHEDLGELRWTMSEYPAGAEGPKTTDVGKHKLIEDFEFGLQHEPEYEEDDSYSALRDILKANPTLTARTTKSRMVEQLVEWFRQYHEDPANETPYNGQEGGYLYIHGGPYSAEEELRDNFEDIVSEEAIMEAVDEIQKDGTWEWAPSSLHPAKMASYDEAMAEQDQEEVEIDFDELREIASERKPSGIGSDEERSMRVEILQQISAARSEMPLPPSHGGIGHNHPPEGYELHGQELENAAESLNVIEVEFANDVPDVVVVAEQTSFLKTALGWVAGKLDTTIDEFCKGFGSTLGKAAGVALPAAILSLPYWGKIAALFGSLKGWLLLLLV
jgi:hypothetical protein